MKQIIYHILFLVLCLVFFSCASMVSLSARRLEPPYKDLSEIFSKNELKAAEAWNARILMVEIPQGARKKSDLIWYEHSAHYLDSNKNRKIDPADRGFFEPGSTVKVVLGALFLEKNKTPSEAQWQDLKRMIVISDNDATNRVIDEIGILNIKKSLESKKLENIVIARKMLAKAPDATDLPCVESGELPGNCASAHDLAEVYLRLFYPGWYDAAERFSIPDTIREQFIHLLSLTPKEAGFVGFEDEYCRLVQRTVQKRHSVEVMYSKCGVSPFGNWWTDYSLVRYKNGSVKILILSVHGAEKKDPEIYDAINSVAEKLL